MISLSAISFPALLPQNNIGAVLQQIRPPLLHTIFEAVAHIIVETVIHAFALDLLPTNGHPQG
jgi:hypothetical protein